MRAYCWHTLEQGALSLATHVQHRLYNTDEQQHRFTDYNHHAVQTYLTNSTRCTVSDAVMLADVFFTSTHVTSFLDMLILPSSLSTTADSGAAPMPFACCAS